MLGAIPMENDGGKTHNKVNQLVRYFLSETAMFFFEHLLFCFFLVILLLPFPQILHHLGCFKI